MRAQHISWGQVFTLHSETLCSHSMTSALHIPHPCPFPIALPYHILTVLQTHYSSSNHASEIPYLCHIFESNISFAKVKTTLLFALCERQNQWQPLFENLLSQRGGRFFKSFWNRGGSFYWYRCSHFLRGKLALVKGQLFFWDPFKIELAAFLKLTLVKGWLLFWDPFKIGVATFFEISISNCVFHI